jgi:vitamin-K-epoxide reductase (warfarin-sensitive)
MQTSVTASAAHSAGKVKRLMRVIALLAILGVVVSSVSLYHHFSASKTSFCDIGQAFNCDLVNRSQYSSFAGIPVALIGIVGYLLILAFATLYREKAETPVMLMIASLAGLGFALYLTYIEARVLDAWCILCLSSLATILAIAVLGSITAMTSAKRA